KFPPNLLFQSQKKPNRGTEVSTEPTVSVPEETPTSQPEIPAQAIPTLESEDSVESPSVVSPEDSSASKQPSIEPIVTPVPQVESIPTTQPEV
ncbi:MAG: hypothetical protein HC847_25940, partial [Hydrococcus sp. RU_2_2]|nr:hypothetical protein [Hydrococcus sp. RU_2_2]